MLWINFAFTFAYMFMLDISWIIETQWEFLDNDKILVFCISY